MDRNEMKRVLLFALVAFGLLSVPVFSAGFADEKKPAAGNPPVFRDDFTGLAATQWQIAGWTQGVTCADGMLKLKTAGGPAKTISVTSSKLFRYASLEARVRFSRLGKPTFHYVGFMSRATWADPAARCAAWLMDCESDHFQLWTAKSGTEVANMGRADSGPLEVNRWYTVKIVWTPQYVELFTDGVSNGKAAKPEAVPEVAMPVVFDLASTNEEVEMDVDWVEIKGEQIEPESIAAVPEVVPLPLKAKRRVTPLPERSPTVTLAAGTAVLENQYYRYDLALSHGPVITALVNKYIGATIIDGQSRLFLIQRGKQVFSNDGYKLLAASVESSGSDRILHVTYRAGEAPLEIDLALRVGQTPELACQATLKNQGEKEDVVGVTCPILEHLRIGDKVEDDVIFYPSETGMCGSVDYDLRAIYGYSLWMQVMDVFDPAVGGGIYAYAKDSTGTPKILMAYRRSVANKKPRVHDNVWYENQNPGDIYDKQPGSALAFRHLECQLKPGETAALPEMVVGVHQGDWHDPLRSYSTWAHRWYKKEFPTPQWYMDTYALLSGHPFAGLHLLSRQADLSKAGGGFWDPEQKAYRYSRQMGIAEENSLMEFAMWHEYQTQKPKMALDEVYQEYNGDIISAFILGNNDYPVDRGGLEPLRQEISGIHTKGGRFLLYSYPEAISGRSRVFQAHGKAWAAMSAPNTYATRFTAEGKGWNYCIYLPAFQDWFSQMMSAKVTETGSDGFRQDVLSYMFPCFNPAHPHYRGTLRSALPAGELNQLLRSTQAAMRAIGLDRIATTEHAGSDYLTQHSDGYLAQNMAWFTDPAFNSFRGFNQYKLCFMRFYFPEVKEFMSGITPVETAVKTGLFNASGLAIMPPAGALVFDSIRENGDAVNSLIPPEPYVDTLLEHVYANYFPGPAKTLWTLWNRSGKNLDQPLLEVPFKTGVHYVEVLNDLPVKAETNGKTVRLSVPVKDDDVICIIEVPVVIATKVTGDLIAVSVTASGDYTLQVAGDKDRPGNRQCVKLIGGKASLKKTGKTVIKLMKDYYLIDEVIVE